MDAALERMSADYDLVVAVVMSVAEVWGPVSEELHVMQETLTGVDGVGRGEPVISPNELRATREAVDEAVLAARDDPLWVCASVAHRPRGASGAAGRGTSRRRRRAARAAWTHELREAGQLVEAAVDLAQWVPRRVVARGGEGHGARRCGG